MDYLSGPKSGDIVPLRGRRTLAQGGRGMTTEKIYSHMAKREAGGLYFSIIGVVKASTPLLDLQVPGWGSRCLLFLATCHRSLRGPAHWPWSNPGSETPDAGLEFQDHSLLPTESVDIPGEGQRLMRQG